MLILAANYCKNEVLTGESWLGIHRAFCGELERKQPSGLCLGNFEII